MLWISRHQLTAAQLADLQRIYGNLTIVQWGDTVSAIEELTQAVAQADVIGAVLPIDMVGQLLTLAGEKPVIMSKAVRTPIPGKPGEFSFAHGGWKQFTKVEIKAKLL